MKAEDAQNIAAELHKAEDGSDEQRDLRNMLAAGSAVNVTRIADALEDIARIAGADAGHAPAFGPLIVATRYKRELEARREAEAQ